MTTAEVMELVKALALQQQQFMEQQQQAAQNQNELIKAFLSKKAVGSLDQHTNVPTFKSFDKSNERWNNYLGQLNQHFEAHQVTDDDQKRAYFLSWVGIDTYDLLTKLFGQKDISKEKFSELVSQLTAYFKAKTHVLAARYKFLSTKMKSGQLYTEWVADLKGIARDCNFICEKDGVQIDYTDMSIRDAIILQTPHDTVRNSALQYTNPSLDEVLKIAEAYESTQRTVKTIKGETIENSPEIFQMTSHYQNRRPRKRNFSKERAFSKDKFKSCPNCGVNHSQNECKFRDAVCHICKKPGHISTICLWRGRNPIKGTVKFNDRRRTATSLHRYQQNEANEVASLQEQVCNEVIPWEADSKIYVPLEINGQPLQMQLDTGATCSLINLDAYKLLGSPACIGPMTILKAFNGIPVDLKGKIIVAVKYKNVTKKLPLLVVNSKETANLFGMNWFQAFKFNVNSKELTANLVDTEELKESLKKICERHENLFQSGLGTCNTYKASLKLKTGATPKFFKPRPIPFAQMDKVKEEIDRLTKDGIWKPVKTSQWATPIVAVPKPNGSIRICGDFKITVNPQIEVDQYPIPRPEELFQKLRNGKYFSKVDLSDAYLQLELDDESKKLMVVNTPYGLFEYQRLPFGIASAPAIYQRFVEQIISGIPGCANYLDDIIVTGSNQDEHLKNLGLLFTRLEENGLRCNKKKCEFFKRQVEYLGHIIDADGIKPSESSVEAIRKLPRPKNIQELQSFMGKVNYYNKFVKGFAQIATPLNQLRKKNAQFKWTSQQESAFKKLKEEIINETKLVHFDPDQIVVLATDASSYGIGAVLSHKYPDGTEKPIAYASKTLNEHQVRYSQIEKEALSIIYGVKKFNQYLYGRKFELITDHKPLISIFHPNKQLPVMTVQRLQRWAIILMGYNYEIRYRPTEKHGNADALSRLPAGPDEKFDKSEESCFHIDEEINEVINSFPIDHRQIREAMSTDPTLKCVMQYVKSGWPNYLPKNQKFIQPYFNKKAALGTSHGLLILQTDFTRVIIPSIFQKKILKTLHDGHWGIVRMKQMARRYCWWPNMDKQLEQMVSRCEPCQMAKANPKKDFHNWPQAKEPWERIHIDYAGPFWNAMWFLCVDAYSQFPYIMEMSSTTTGATLNALQKIFTIEGLPRTIVSDNGTQFVSKEFEDFCNRNGIEHLTTAPFHPASNGEAERFVRTFKEAMKKANWGGENKQNAHQKLLITYRTTPSPNTGKSPAELLHGRQPRILLSLVLPPKENSRTENQSKFQINDQVYAKNFSKGQPWLQGKVIKQVGKMIYIIQIANGTVKRHQNQLRKCSILKPANEETTPNEMELIKLPQKPAAVKENSTATGNYEIPPVQLRRSTRVRKPVVHFSP